MLDGLVMRPRGNDDSLTRGQEVRDRSIDLGRTVTATQNGQV